jgi:hypothetical protein
MFKVFLISIVVVPVLLGMQAARARHGRRGLAMLLAAFFAYDVLYLLMLYYLRFRWSAG